MVWNLVTRWKINMESKNGSLEILEADFPFQLGDFKVPATSFPGFS